MVDVGQHHEQPRVQAARQQAGREVLVDYRLDAVQLAVAVGGRNAAAARADGDDAFLDQQADGLDLDDLDRLRRRHDAPEVGPVGGDRPALVALQALGLAAAVDRSDRLGRVLERRVLRIDHDLRQHRDDVVLLGNDVAEFLLDHVADHADGLGADHVQRVGVDRLVGLVHQRQQADLRPVAVGDHQLVLVVHARQLARRDADVAALVLDVERLAPLQQGVAAECDDDGHDLNLKGSRPAGP